MRYLRQVDECTQTSKSRRNFTCLVLFKFWTGRGYIKRATGPAKTARWGWIPFRTKRRSRSTAVLCFYVLSPPGWFPYLHEILKRPGLITQQDIDIFRPFGAAFIIGPVYLLQVISKIVLAIGDGDGYLVIRAGYRPGGAEFDGQQPGDLCF